MSEWNYFEVITVDSASFPDTPQVNFDFLSQGFALLNRGANVVEYSFDGSTVHGDLNPSDTSKDMIFDYRTESKIWFRYSGGSSTVRVEAWRGRN